MDQSDERRNSFRLPFMSKVVCHVDMIDKNYRGTLRDLSTTGFFMETDDCPQVYYKCNIEIILEGEHSRLVIDNLSGSIIRNDDGGVGVRFDERLEWFSLVPFYFNKLREDLTDQ